MKPTLTFPSGYAQRLPSGDIEIKEEDPVLAGLTPKTKIPGAKILLPKSDAELLAKFILEGE